MRSPPETSPGLKETWVILPTPTSSTTWQQHTQYTVGSHTQLMNKWIKEWMSEWVNKSMAKPLKATPKDSLWRVTGAVTPGSVSQDHHHQSEVGGTHMDSWEIMGSVRIKPVLSVLFHWAVPGPEPKINSSQPSSLSVGISEVSLIKLSRLELPTILEMPQVTMDLSVKRMK